MSILVEIIPNLWYGSIDACTNYGFLSNYHIKKLIIANRRIKIDNHELPIETINIRNSYYDSQILLESLDNFTESIHNHISNNEGVLIICDTGIQCSPTIIAGYLMKYGKMKWEIAKKAIKMKEKTAFEEQATFQDIMKIYETQIKF